jgi:hypothetical protein
VLCYALYNCNGLVSANPQVGPCQPAVVSRGRPGYVGSVGQKQQLQRSEVNRSYNVSDERSIYGQCGPHSSWLSHTQLADCHTRRYSAEVTSPWRQFDASSQHCTAAAVMAAAVDAATDAAVTTATAAGFWECLSQLVNAKHVPPLVPHSSVLVSVFFWHIGMRYIHILSLQCIATPPSHFGSFLFWADGAYLEGFREYLSQLLLVESGPSLTLVVVKRPTFTTHSLLSPPPLPPSTPKTHRWCLS